MHAEVRDAESQRTAEMFLGSEEKIGLTEDFYFYAQRRIGREPAEELRRRRHEETVTGAINSSPPQRR